MKFGYDCVKRMKDELLAFMAKHNFETLAALGPQPAVLHHPRRPRAAQAAAKEAEKAAAATKRSMVTKDTQWTGDKFVEQSAALSR